MVIWPGRALRTTTQNGHRGGRSRSIKVRPFYGLKMKFFSMGPTSDSHTYIYCVNSDIDDGSFFFRTVEGIGRNFEDHLQF